MVFILDVVVPINRVTKQVSNLLTGKNYKRIPKGYDPDSPFADYLLYDGVFGWYENKNVKELYDKDAAEIIYKIFKDMLPLHQWFVRNLL